MSEETEEILIQHLHQGEKGRVVALEGGADEIARLSALGLRTGVEICSLRKGCPCIVQLGCSRMCLRTADDFKVLVSRVD